MEIKSLLKNYKRFITVVLSVLLVLSAIPMGWAFATGEKVVVTTAYTTKDGETVFATIGDAIDHLGASGGTIYINGEVAADSLASTSASEHGKIVIEGYTGKEADALALTSGTAVIYGDFEFNNIKITAPSFSSRGKTVTIGENVDTSGFKFGNHGVGSDNIVINSGDNSANVFYFFNSYVAANGIVTKTFSANYVMNGGKLGTVYMGNANGSSKPTFNLNGDVSLWLKGGEISKLYLGAYMQNNSYHNTLGHFSFRMSGGSITTLYYGGAYKYSGQKDNYNTMALVFDNATITNNVTITKYDTKDTVGTVELGVLVLNNYEVNKVTVPTAVNNDMKYKVYVTEGKAEPVFERTDAADPSTSTLKGFEINSDIKGYVPFANGAKLVVNEETGLYDLPQGTVNVTFDFDGEWTHIVAPEGTELSVGEKLHTDVSTAINALGDEGGTIYVKGEVTTEAGLEDGTLTSRGTVTIEGYGNTAEGNKLTITNAQAALSGDVIFKNIALATGNKFNTGAHTVTFGEGTVNVDVKFVDGPFPGTLIIDSEDFEISKGIALGANKSANNSNLVLNSGSIVKGANQFAVLLGIYNNATGTAGLTQTGNMAFTMNGGTIQHLYIGYVGNGQIGWNSADEKKQGSGGDVYFTGNIFFNMNAGKVTDKVYFATVSNYANAYMNNVVYTFNNATMDNAVTVSAGSRAAYTLKNPNTPDAKWIIIENNYVAGKVSVESSVRSMLDYFVTVAGGAANAEFDGTTFKGFTITANEENAGKLVVANGTDILTAVDGLYDLSAYEGLGAINISFLTAKEIDTAEEKVEGEALADYKNGALPKKDGYLFAGFYAEDSDKAMNAEEFAAAESVVVKFIPKAVLNIGWQIAKGDNGTANLRLISTVDSLQYEKVIFVLKTAGRDDMVLESKKVYTGIKGFVNGESVEYDPTYFSNASEYFMTHVITGIPESFHSVDFTVTASLVTKDGQEITGDALTFKLESARDYAEIMGK